MKQKRRYKTKYYPDELKYIKDNFYEISKAQLLDDLNSRRGLNNKITLQQLRHELRRRGFMKMIQIRWTKTQTKFLKQNYKIKGDTEIAEILNNTRSHSKKVFTVKHVNKKRRLINLSRTKDEIKNIRKRNEIRSPAMCFQKGHTSSNKREEGSIAIRKGYKGKIRTIKIDGIIVYYGRWIYEQKYGKIPKGYKMYRKDYDKLNDNIENLYIKKAGRMFPLEKIEAIKLLKKRIASISRKNASSIGSVLTKERGWEMSRLNEILYRLEKPKKMI